MAKRWSGYLILGMWLLNLLHLYLGFSPWPAAIAATSRANRVLPTPAPPTTATPP